MHAKIILFFETKTKKKVNFAESIVLLFFKKNKRMDNKKLISLLSKKTKTTQEKSNEFLSSFIEEITNEMANGADVEFLDLGIFENIVREQKIITNPKTQKKILYPPKNIVDLKVAKQIKEYLKTIEK